jgi:hypothetical protein
LLIDACIDDITDWEMEMEKANSEGLRQLLLPAPSPLLCLLSSYPTPPTILPLTCFSVQILLPRHSAAPSQIYLSFMFLFVCAVRRSPSSNLTFTEYGMRISVHLSLSQWFMECYGTYFILASQISIIYCNKFCIYRPY